MKITLVNPQWQGGADLSTLYGAQEIQDYYLEGQAYDRLSVPEEPADLPLEDDVWGKAVLGVLMERTRKWLEDKAPDKLFTIGGSCDADISSLAWLNARYSGNLTVLWLDAHGDINAPWESATKLFYGMPVRALLEPAGQGLAELVERPLVPEQIAFAGCRDLDEPEKRFLQAASIPVITVDDWRADPTVLQKWVSGKNQSHLYIHLDLDVLDPLAFPNTPVPVAGGIPFEVLMASLEGLKADHHVVGFGLYEYMPCGRKLPMIGQLMDFGLEL